jgi:hypothetical protein
MLNTGLLNLNHKSHEAYHRASVAKEKQGMRNYLVLLRALPLWFKIIIWLFYT